MSKPAEIIDILLNLMEAGLLSPEEAKKLLFGKGLEFKKQLADLIKDAAKREDT